MDIEVRVQGKENKGNDQSKLEKKRNSLFLRKLGASAGLRVQVRKWE